VQKNTSKKKSTKAAPQRKNLLKSPNTTLVLADIEDAEARITKTEEEIETTKEEGRSEAYLISLQNTLTERIALKSNLIVREGELCILF